MARTPQDHRSGRKTAKAPPPGPRSLVQIVTTDEADEAEPIPVFAIDGTTYTMPAHVSASVSLQALHLAREEGMEVALSWVMEEVLGEEAYTALRTCKALTAEQLGAIMDHVQEHTMGELEAASGN